VRLDAGHQHQVPLALRGTDDQHSVGWPADPSGAAVVELDDRPRLGEVEEGLGVDVAHFGAVQAFDQPFDG